MEQIQYVPVKSHAQSKSNMISFSIARDPKDMLGNPFFSDVLCGISDAAKRYDYNVQFSLYYNVEEQIEKTIKLFKQKQADGFIFTSVLSSDKELLLKSMQEKEIPFVIIGSSLNHNIFSVHNDNIRDSYMATKYLIGKGYREILFLTPDLKKDVMYDRVLGYHRAIQELEQEMYSTHVVYSSNDEAEMAKVLDKVIEDGVTFDAIITMESIMSLNAMKYCQSRNMSVPEDVGILSFNNAPYLDKISPSITGVNLNPTLLGAEAFQLLIDLIDTEPKAMVQKSVTLPSEIIERQSTQRTKTLKD